uniref:DNA polymerase n=1 Tax=Psilocybe cubensis TaxID=181762 RepID=A0A8H7YAJ4_PSICU
MQEHHSVQANPSKIPKLQVRINQIDYAVITPGQLDNSTLPKVPVLRIFGSSSTGQSACVHVHQVYPYIFIQYLDDLSPQHVKQYISKLFRSLNHAIALSLKRDPSSRKSHYIRAILLVKGIHFYGFHSSYSPFLKILVSDPGLMTRAVTILQSGSVMGARFTVYESHLSYVLQFLADFGLYGCGTIDIEDALERGISEDDPPTTIRFGASPYFREARVPLELDVIAPHILNRHNLVPRNIHHQLQILPVAEPPPPDPLIPSVRELWEDERNHRRSLGLNPSPEIPVDPSDSSRSGKGEWISEARWWDEIRKRILEGKDAPQPTEAFHGWDDRFVMTTFESIEALWEKQYTTWKPPKRSADLLYKPDGLGQNRRDQEYNLEDGGSGDDKHIQIEVDISMFSNEEFYQEDEQNWNPEQLNGISAIIDNEDIMEENEYDEVPDDGSDTMEEIVRDERSNDPFVDDRPGQEGITEYRLESPRPPRESSPQALAESPSFVNSVLEENLSVKPQKFTEEHASQNEGLLPDSLEIADQLITTVNSKGLPDEDWNRGIKGVDSPKEIISLGPEETLPAIPSAEERFLLIHARAVQLSKIHDTFKKASTNSYVYSLQPPTWSYLQSGLQSLCLPDKVYQAPYYSNDFDIPEHSREYAGLTYRLKGGQGIATLEDWSSTEPHNELVSNAASGLVAAGVGGWEYASHPPSTKEIRQSIKLVPKFIGIAANSRSQIEGPTQANIFGFKNSPLVTTSLLRKSSDLSIMSVEVFVPTVDDKIPNADHDKVVAIFYSYHISGSESIQNGVMVLQNPQINPARLRHVKYEVLDTELDLLNKLIDLVIELDPDILTGWELQLSSWGYLQMRADTYGLTFSELISRAPPREPGASLDQWSLRKTSTFKVAGRHVLNLWRIMRSENNLTSYTFENVAFEVLGKRVPKYSYKTLTEWYQSPVPSHTSLLVNHFSMRAYTNLELLERTETVTKTAEFARVFGVDFFSVLSRGSQFKVESFMFRIAKPESFVLISPSKTDVGKQNAAECMPLILEPASAFYSSPLLVLDFQSLYPSVMIAYNYCYSTCLGRITSFQGTYKFGVVNNLDIPAELIEKLQDHINVAPNGMMYVKPNVRKGLLGRMLVELLDTRVMVKQAMKLVGGDKARKRILDARQLSLKYIANVTYGYTSASFSGRMPAVEIADSIVQSGRETLEKAIDIIDGTSRWGAKVVYGDTDSVFVYLPGKTKEQAFAIGNEIAETITSMNPVPIKLKFEKAS